MEQDAKPVPAAEQRAFAVALLKRAASLPRMKDGRRPPPMHADGVSEGEKSDVRDQVGTEHSPEPEEQVEEEVREREQTQEVEEIEMEVEIEEKPEALLEEGQLELLSPTPEPVIRKRRPRSRSRSRPRSRNSKDKAKGMQSPTPSPLVRGTDSSRDNDSPTPPPPADEIGVSRLVSPVPSRLAELQRSQLLMMVPAPSSPEPNMVYPGTSPPTPMLPSLEALQKGLHRSNSAAARMMAMHKLTGGAETYDNRFSPSPGPSSMLSRNNTVSGGERRAVGRLMLNRLKERLGDTDDNQTSAGEELVGPIPPRRRRRRSRKSSVSANNNPTLSDPEAFSTTADTTPSVATQPSLSSLDAFPERFPSRGPSATPSRPYTPQFIVQEQQNEVLPAVHVEKEKPRRRRSLVVEEDDPVEQPPLPQTRYPGLPVTPQRLHAHLTSPRVPHASDAPSSSSTDSGPQNGTPVPFYLSATQSRQEMFPSSPFGTPLKEKPSRDDDEEEVLYQAHHQRVLPTDMFDREISWVAMPVPKLPLDENEDGDEEEYDNEDDDERPPSTHSSKNHSSQTFDDTSQQDSADTNQDFDNSSLRESKEVIIESEICLESVPSVVHPSPSSTAALSQVTRVSDDSFFSQVYPARLSVASRLQSERSPLTTEFSDYDDSRASAETPAKREKDAPGAWEKVKRSLSRSGSTTGRRSRTNSLSARERRDQIDSGISRESGASIGSAKMERADSNGPYSQQSQGPLMMTPSASASMMSVAPPARGGVSPVPPATSADLLKYQSTKLFPFPGIEKLKEQRKKQNAGSSSTPDVTLGAFEMEQQASGSSSNTPVDTMEMFRDRKLSHQASDSRLIARFNTGSPQISATASNSSQVDYSSKSLPQPGAPLVSNLKLPMNRAGVKQWLSAKKIFSSQSPNPSSPQLPDNRSPTLKNLKKPSLSDLLLGRKETDLSTDWEEISSDKSKTPTSAASTAFHGKQLVLGEQRPSPVEPGANSIGLPRYEHTDTEKTPRARKVAPFLEFKSESDTSIRGDNPPSTLSSPPTELPSSGTPDPVSSLEDYPPQSTSESSSNTSSQYSHFPAGGSQGAIVLERLDDMLGRGSRSPMWAAAVEDPPRKLLLSSPVLQVVNANTVKDRFLFLFSDLLVIAKPIIQDQDTILDCYKPTPLDRKFIVKSVALLRLLKFSPDREEPQAKTASFIAPPRNPAVTPFVRLFAKDPDHAVNSLLEKVGNTQEATVLISQLLFKTLDLDRARLGEFLSRRSSKALLKTYVDEFGFSGMRVDEALRVFLLSLNVPTTPSHNHSPIDYMADAFASRWYEANANIVAYDKDLAIRLVRAVIQLNEVLHGGVTSEGGPTGYPKRNVTSRDFLEAFRRYDGRSLVSDELLENVYAAIRRECLAQASSTASTMTITIKRPLPPRLTYRIQSEPIILRIPQVDPHLTIQLYGQDLIFDPPSLTFAKSTESSFRVTGTSLGSKKMLIWRSGSSAFKYSGLPLSSSLVVERAFMRNTFQVAFLNHNGIKRKYMFSVDDPLIRHQWSVSLKRQIDIATALAETSGTNPPWRSKFHRAAEVMAFRVLQETLIGSERLPASAIEKTVQRLGNSAQSSLNSGARFTPEPKRGANGRPNRAHDSSSHSRSKSRSRMYHRHGAGKLELELNRSGGYISSDEDDEEGNGMTVGAEDETTRPEGRLWSGRDLELHCQQNSSIALVLAFLQVGSPDRGQGGS